MFLLALTIGLAVLATGGALAFVGIRAFERMTSGLTARKTGTDPILGPKDRIAIYDRAEPFILMPDHLKTKEEMVEWMTKELPKLTAGKHRSGV